MQTARAQQHSLAATGIRSESGDPLVSDAARQPNFGADPTKVFWGPGHGRAKDLLMVVSPHARGRSRSCDSQRGHVCCRVILHGKESSISGVLELHVSLGAEGILA